MLLDSSALQLIDTLLEEMSVWCQPSMPHDRRQVCTAGGIGDEHDGQEIPRLLGDVVGEGKGSVDDVLVEQIDVVAVRVGRDVIEGEVASEHSVQDNST